MAKKYLFVLFCFALLAACASADLSNNSSCNVSADCLSWNCNGGLCCDPGDCGYSQYGRCLAEGATLATGPGTTYQCVNGTLLKAHGSDCSNASDCMTSKCINGACCYDDQCAYQFQTPFKVCVDVNVTVNLPSGAIACASEGVWIKGNNRTCSNASECFSGICNAGVCCGYGECGFSSSSYFGECYSDGAKWYATAGSMYQCVNGTRMRSYGSACLVSSECVTGTCVNNACCYAGQCAYQHMASVKTCVDYGEITPPYSDVCAGDGVWKTGYQMPCSTDSQCFSGSCDTGICCNMTQCAYNGSCYDANASLGDMVCVDGSWENVTQCRSMWWFDEVHNTSCGYKEFCGAYMYPGLRTFNSSADCVRALPVCVHEGETAVVYPGATGCCLGLSMISITNVVNGTCAMPALGAQMCAYCGNGVCGAGENWCNCAADCLNASCRSLWWFDGVHNASCGYNEFCGAYIYPGLMTFESEAGCVGALPKPCVTEGQTSVVYPGAADCCHGLSRISITNVVNGTCAMPALGAQMCAYCGNGVCGLGENVCNCPADCPGENVSCKFLWWFDDEHRGCSYSEFCGAYTYYGLRTFESEEECVAQIQCFPGVKLIARGAGNITDYRGMELRIDGRLAARWNALNIYRQYEYERDYSCGPHTIELLNAGNETLKVYWLEAECESLLSEEEEIGSGQSLFYSHVRECNETCVLRGDTMPCGIIPLSEVIGLISEWTFGRASLDDVVHLIGVWASE